MAYTPLIYAAAAIFLFSFTSTHPPLRFSSNPSPLACSIDQAGRHSLRFVHIFSYFTPRFSFFLDRFPFTSTICTCSTCGLVYSLFFPILRMTTTILLSSAYTFCKCPLHTSHPPLRFSSNSSPLACSIDQAGRHSLRFVHILLFYAQISFLS
jgi:hypothetical protein